MKPPNDGTSPDPVEEPTSPETGGQEPSPEGESPDAAEESLSPEQIQRWKALEAKAQEQNVDFGELLPEYTRSRQRAKELEDENALWRDHVQKIYAQQQTQAQQQDPEGSMTQQIVEAESIGDYEKANNLRSQLIAHQTRKIAREEFQNLSQTQQQQQVRAGLLETARKRYNLSEREVDELANRAVRNPEALARAIAWERDPDLVREEVLRDQREREKKAQDAGSTRSIASSGGRRVPGEAGEDAAPVKVPAAIYYAFPESVAKRKWPNAEIVKS